MAVSDLTPEEGVAALLACGLAAQVGYKERIIGGTTLREENGVKLYSDPFSIIQEGTEWVGTVTLDLCTVAVVSVSLRGVIMAIKSFKQGARGGF